MRKIYVAVFLVSSLAASCWAQGVPSSSEVQSILLKHMQAFNDGGLEATVSAYDDSAVLITGAGVTKGKEAIRMVFQHILASHPHLELKAQFFTENVGYIGWVQNQGTAGEISGADTFVVRNGKIVAQTVTALRPTKPAAVN